MKDSLVFLFIVKKKCKKKLNFISTKPAVECTLVHIKPLIYPVILLIDLLVAIGIGQLVFGS